MTVPPRQPTARKGAQAPKLRQETPSTPRRVKTGAGVRSGAQKPRAASELEDMLAEKMRLHGLPTPEREVLFHPTRKWRLDFCWPAVMLAVEIEGGVYRGGGHSSVSGIKRDLEKGNALTLLGWRLLRFHGDQIRSGEAVAVIREALAPAATGADGGGA